MNVHPTIHFGTAPVVMRCIDSGGRLDSSVLVRSLDNVPQAHRREWNRSGGDVSPSSELWWVAKKLISTTNISQLTAAKFATA
jgi:hypothetical protein